MADEITRSGVLIRMMDDTLFYVSIEALLAHHRLPDNQQKGSPEGDAALGSLDRCSYVVGLKNCILTDGPIEEEVLASSPNGSKEKFNTSNLANLTEDCPRRGKEKYSSFTD